MDYLQAINTLTSEKNFHIDLSLSRIKNILEYFDNPQDKLKYILVAGTNGKGSVCSMLSAILTEAGYKTGLYTSPHIFEYTERIKLNGIDISKENFAKYFDKIQKACNLTNTQLTEFEILTVIMFLYFKDNNTDIVVLETGLGGRLDATNVIKENLCSIITTIDLDHTNYLGNTKEKIATEKAGIIKKGCPVVTSMGYEVIKDKADSLGSMMLFTSPFVQTDILKNLSLKGLHQEENLALVLACINYVFPDISEETIKSALIKVKNPFRFEYFEKHNLIVDACHNPNGAIALRNNLDYYYPFQNRRFIFGCLRRKDYKQMMEILFSENDEIYFNEFDYKEACTFYDLTKACNFPAQKYTDESVLTTDKLNIICGSFYMLSGFRKLFT